MTRYGEEAEPNPVVLRYEDAYQSRGGSPRFLRSPKAVKAS